MNEFPNLLDLASLSMPLTKEQRNVLMQEVDWHGASDGALFFPVLDPSVSDEELIREVDACRKRNPILLQEFRPKDYSTWVGKSPTTRSEPSTKELPHLPLNELQRRQLFEEILRHASNVGAALVPRCESDEELISEARRVRQPRWY